MFDTVCRVCRAVCHVVLLGTDIFLPLFEVTKNPSLDPVLHRFITEQVSGFDSVDNEDVAERKDLKTCPADPRRWDTKENPPYAYYLYFMWANVWSLNKYRETRSLNTFDFRSPLLPMCACVCGRMCGLCY